MLEGTQHIDAVEHPDVLRLHRRDPPDGPHQLDIVRLVRRMGGKHAHLLGQMAALPVVTRRTRCDDVLPHIQTAARDRDDVVARQECTAAQFRAMTQTVHAAVPVPGEEKGVGDLSTEFAGDVNVAHEADNQRTRYIPPCRSEDSGFVDLEDLRLSVDHEPQRALDGKYRQRLERRIQRQAT